MEASALRAPAGLGHRPVARLLRLRSDDQLVALFRLGNEDAFRVIHDRYRQRLFAYTRQMMAASRADAEDALQDVFLRAYHALRADDRPVTLRAWLYRVAHNRCVDHLRRPQANVVELFDNVRSLHDPMTEVERREDLRRLVADVRRLPGQQRSALLMREMEGLTYQELADALDVSVPAIKSLLVRARMGLVEAREARDTACVEIRGDLDGAHDRGARASGRARRHVRECDACSDYRASLKGLSEGFAALSPASGPWVTLAKLFGIGGAGSSAAAGSGAAAGGGAAASGTVAIGGGAVTAKVAAVVCCAALVGGGAVEATQIAGPDAAPHASAGAAGRAATAIRALPRRPLAARVDAFDVRAPTIPATRPSAHSRGAIPPMTHVTTSTTPGAAAERSMPVPAGADPADVATAQQTGGLLAPDEEAPAPAPASSTTPSALPILGPPIGTPTSGSPPGASGSAPAAPSGPNGNSAAAPATPPATGGGTAPAPSPPPSR